MLAILFAVFAFVFYGPFDYVRNMWINTAMNTSNCKILAKLLYSDGTIEKVLAQSFVVNKENTSDGGFENTYSDEVIYSRLEGATFEGHMIAVKDPTRINMLVGDDEQGVFVEELVNENGYLGGINGAGFVTEYKRGMIWGHTVADGKVINNCDRGEQQHFICGMNYKGKLIVGRFSDEELAQKEFLWAVEFGPVLIVNGKKNEISDTAGGLAPRSAIGQTQNGTILLVVIDGRRPDSLGATYKDVQTIMENNGAINAFLLDGGSSSSMCYNGKLVNIPSGGDEARTIPTVIAYK